MMNVPSYKYPVHHLEIEDDISIAYVDEGPKEGPIVVMIHGWGGYIKNWYPTIDALRSQCRCVALDLPGYGRSTVRDFGPVDYMDFFADAIDQFINRLGVRNVTLVGHSMGGQICGIVALKGPDWLDQLILAAPAGFETFNSKEVKLLEGQYTEEFLAGFDEAQMRAAYDLNFMNPMAVKIEDMIQDWLKVKKTSDYIDHLKVRIGALYGMLQHPIENKLGKIEVPTIVLFGNNDRLIPHPILHSNSSTNEILMKGKAIRKVRLYEIEAGHMLQMDNSEAFNSIIIKHLIK